MKPQKHQRGEREMETLSYHPDSPYYGKAGYLGFLSSQQSQDLNEMEMWMSDQNIDISDLCLNTLSPKLTLLRYLRANKFVVDKAKAHILRNLEWRAEMDVKGICSKTPDELLGCDLEKIVTLYPHWQSGVDCVGRPIVYKQYGSAFDATKILNLSSKEGISKYHIWEQEACMRLCYEHSLRTGYIVETITCIIDIGGITLSQVTRDFLSIIKLIAEIDQSQYPETLGHTFIINASSLFPMVWRMIRPWLDPVVASKIQILGAVEEWHPCLLDEIGPDFLSSAYGGNAEYLDLSVHPYAAIVFDETGENLEMFPPETFGEIGTISRRMRVEEGRKAPRIEKRKKSPRLSGSFFSSDETKTNSKVKNFTSLMSHDLDDQNDIISLGSSQPDLESGHHEQQPTTSLKYSVDSPYYDREGYLGCLNEQQVVALESLQNWLIDERIDVSDLALNSLHPRLTLLRYLRANKFCVEKAIEKIKLNIDWRSEMKIKELIHSRPDEILGCEMSELVKVFPHWQSGNDQFGRPVLYKQYNNSFDATKILKMSSTEAITKYHIWEQEACMRLCYEQSKKSGCIVETLTAVIDVKGMQLYQVTRDFLGIVKAIADIDQNHYPETLGQTFIINTPSVFPLVWRGVKPWLDPVVASKIQIFGQNESEWFPVLDKAIGRAHIPATYGGALPNLDSNLHPYESILGQLPSGSDGKGLSIGDRMKLFDHQNSSTHHSHSHKSTQLGLSSANPFSSHESCDSSSVCSSAFGDAIDGHDPTFEYSGWDNEIQFLRSMVQDINSESHSEMDFEDCMEHHPDPQYEDIQKILSSSYLYQVYQFLKSARNALISFYKCLIPKYLLRLPKNSLCKYLNYSALIATIISLTCIGLSGYALSTMYWTSNSELVRFQMWSGVVVLCLASIFSLLNFAGFVGSQTSNRPLLILFNCCLTGFFLVFLVISMVCFAFSTNDPRITGISSEALHHVDSGENLSSVLYRYNIIMGTICCVLSIFSLFPLMLSTAYCELLDRELRIDERFKLNRYSVDRRLYEQTQQLRIVVRLAQFVAIAIGLPMIGYGASALHYLLKIRFYYSLFAVYCLLYSGITSVIASSVGIWTSFSSQLSVLKFYLFIVLPVHIFVLFGTGIVNICMFPHVLTVLNSNYEELRIDEENKDHVSSLLQIELLVSSVLSMSAGCFQLVCCFCVVSYYLRLQQIEIIAARRYDELNQLNQLLLQKGKTTEDAFLYSHHKHREPMSRTDRMIVIWSILIGLIHIYIGGTFAMFAYSIVDSDNIWMVSIWDHLGKYDSRYVTADGFLVSTQGLFALVGGPLLLIYAWTIATKNSKREVIGIIVNSLEIYTQVLYFALEIQNRFGNMSVANPTVFTIGFLLNDIIRVIVPPLIIMHEVRTVVASLNKTTNYHDLKLIESYESQPLTRAAIMKEPKPKSDLNWARYLSLRQRKKENEA